MKFLFWLATAVVYSSWFGDANGASLEVSIEYEHGLAAREQREAARPVVVSWQAVPGKSYNLLSTERLDPAAWAALNPAPLVAETNQQVYRDTNGGGSRFYQVVELNPAVAVTHVGISTQTWLSSDVWVPANQSRVVTGSKTLITLGTWWTGNPPPPSPLPFDSNGIFQSGINVVTNQAAHAPFEVQIAYQTNAAAGAHVITPASLGRSGDGFFLLVEVEGLVAGDSRVDTGHFRISHPFYGQGDPNTIQSITVATDGSAAQAGDLVVAIIGMDNNLNPDINISLPEGWTSLGVEHSALDNICYRACYKIVTIPGPQSVTCSWVSTSCFVAEAGIVVFRAAGVSPALAGERLE